MSVASPRPSAVSSVGHLAEVDDVRFKNHSKFQKRSSIFESRSPRFKERQLQGPGPTTYTIPNKPTRRSRTAVMGSQRRIADTKRSAADAMYLVDVDWTAPMGGRSCGFNSRTSRNSAIRNSDTPDPTAYNTNQSETKLLKENAGSMSVFRSRSPRMSKGKSASSSTQLPISYEMTGMGSSAIRNSCESTFGSKSPRMATTKSTAPPPGSHEVGSAFDAAAVRYAVAGGQFLSRTPRSVVQSSNTPDPGTYNPEKPRKDAGYFTISSTPRDKQQSLRGPGPTSYATSSVFDNGSRNKAGPSFNSGLARFKDVKPRTDTIHDVVDVGTEKGRFVSRAPRMSHRISDTPGPGTYGVKKDSNSGHSFSKSRIPSSRSHTPGPGAYEFQNPRSSLPARGGASAAFRSKSARSCNTAAKQFAPGPGEHQRLDHTNLSQKKARGTPFAFMTEKRFKFNPSDTPGPGACLTVCLLYFFFEILTTLFCLH